METHPKDPGHAVTRFGQPKHQARWRKHTGVILLFSAAAVLLIAAHGQPGAKRPAVPGWVVVERSSTGDDTEAIQAAIDSVAGTGGVVLLPAGIYRHKGLRGRANVHLRGVHVSSTTLDYTPTTGDGVTLEADPDYFTISEVTLTSSGRSGLRRRTASTKSSPIARLSSGGTSDAT